MSPPRFHILAAASVSERSFVHSLTPQLRNQAVPTTRRTTGAVAQLATIEPRLAVMAFGVDF